MQLKQLEEKTDTEYLKKVKDLKTAMEKRMFVAKVFREYEIEMANEEYKREKAAAMQQFEAKGLELKECLLNDLHDKRKAYDQFKHSLDLSTGGWCNQFFLLKWFSHIKCSCQFGRLNFKCSCHTFNIEYIYLGKPTGQ